MSPFHHIHKKTHAPLAIEEEVWQERVQGERKWTVMEYGGENPMHEYVFTVFAFSTESDSRMFFLKGKISLD